jgi:hypothetical protein
MLLLAWFAIKKLHLIRNVQTAHNVNDIVDVSRRLAHPYQKPSALTRLLNFLQKKEKEQKQLLSTRNRQWENDINLKGNYR